jgi:hypothetical protein
MNELIIGKLYKMIDYENNEYVYKILNKQIDSNILYYIVKNKSGHVLLINADQYKEIRENQFV